MIAMTYKGSLTLQVLYHAQSYLYCNLYSILNCCTYCTTSLHNTLGGKCYLCSFCIHMTLQTPTVASYAILHTQTVWPILLLLLLAMDGCGIALKIWTCDLLTIGQYIYKSGLKGWQEGGCLQLCFLYLLEFICISIIKSLPVRAVNRTPIAWWWHHYV